ncbi:unnamed protein product [Fusarium graminearum]|uniref:Chromosome 1, complete genome n=1 Tax=Gibberella zeae (strain ATCC MYA-4620 / CBS 123657 / FGSC 9075 / NRRL 31084 / PH-1) TaxID=229533 RepID=A0A098D6B3_GIBZE|nr:unnamed protein product [Fusarium graminearum]CZS77756.1 unnamed protein product [Fusarium graminearum]
MAITVMTPLESSHHKPPSHNGETQNVGTCHATIAEELWLPLDANLVATPRNAKPCPTSLL